MFNFSGYDVFLERGEKAVYWLMSISLVVYVWQYHLAKSLLLLAAIIAVMLILPRAKDFFSGFSKIDVAWLMALVLYPGSYYLAFLVFDRPLDLSRGNSVAVNSLIAFPLYLLIRKTEYFSLEKFCRYVAPGIAIAGLILIWQWSVEGLDGRWSVGTNLILVFACVATTVSMLCFWYAMYSGEQPLYRLLFLLAGLLGMLTIYASGARGAWLAITVLGCLYVIYSVVRKKYLPLIVVSIVALSAIYLVLEERGSGSRLGNTIATVEKFIQSGEVDDETFAGRSANMRIQMWKAAIDSIQNNPLLGVGSGDFKDTFPGAEFTASPLDSASGNGEVKSPLYLFNHVHNDYLQAWSALGVLGLVSILGLLVIPLWSALSGKSPVAPYIVIVVVVYMMNALTNAPFIRAYSLKYYLIVMGLLLIMHQRDSARSA